jgi:hypothetical protein
MARFAVGGVLIGLVLLGVIRVNQSIANALGSRLTETLATENQILRSQVSLISPRMNGLEMKAQQLNEQVNKLHTLLDRRMIVKDTVWRFTNVTKLSRPKFVNPVTASFHP